MATILAITNQKGGVGKTTTTINLAASLAATRRKVLLIDLDPQGNATSGSGINKKDCEQTINEVLLGNLNGLSTCLQTAAGFDIIPANGRLTVAEVRLLKHPNRETVLKNTLATVQNHYDFIFIDCPPSLNLLTVNALVASDAVIIPVQCEYYALEGLTGLLTTIEQLSRQANPDLHISGILRTMYDGRNRLAVDVSSQLIEHFDTLVYQTIIPRNVRLAEAPSHGLPALIYDKKSQGAIAYLALAGELIRRAEQQAISATKTVDE